MGTWRFDKALPSPDEVKRQLELAPGIKRIQFDTQDLTRWDSGLLTFLIRVMKQSSKRSIVAHEEGLPQGVKRLLALASMGHETKEAPGQLLREPFLSRMGEKAIEFSQSAAETVGFFGEAFSAFLRLLRGRARFRGSDLLLFIEDCGADALPIVTLISALVGLILAFVAAIQLRLFGAQIYVADLVGIAMVRLMGAVMTGVVMAGRTGAAFAAQLGTMQVNEEIDALKTLGIPPMDFLVLPRMLALVLMMPLLCLYADLMGILGGALVGVTMLNLSPMEYYNQTVTAIRLSYVLIGLLHSVVFAVLIALAGCLRGMQCGRSASAVGDAATSAVVTSIVSSVVATAIITFMCDVIGI
jgi:phospholipid/cholesterol/gamma-HCH transport system permease protein